MKRSRFNEEEVIGILREGESGSSVKAVCAKHNISEATYYAWKRKFGGMDVSEARRLRGLEEENARLKRLVADQAVLAARILPFAFSRSSSNRQDSIRSLRRSFRNPVFSTRLEVHRWSRVQRLSPGRSPLPGDHALAFGLYRECLRLSKMH